LRSVLLSFIVLLSFGFSANAQLTTEGKDFWFGFMQNTQDVRRPSIIDHLPSNLEVFFTSKERAQVSVHVFADGRTLDIVVEPGITLSVLISKSVYNPYAAIGSGSIETKAIHVTSDVDISVYALNRNPHHEDATVILPTPTLGNEYYVIGHEELGPLNGPKTKSEFLIVASEDNTRIEITTSVDADGGFSANTPKQITLNRGDIFQVQSDKDLSGTYIKAIGTEPSECKNIAVFGGSQGSSVGYSTAISWSHLYEQMFPLSAWGENFLYIPYESSQKLGDYVKIMASEDGTKVTISGLDEDIEMQSGEVVNLEALKGVRTIVSNKPVSMAQLSQSRSYNTFMIMLSPLEQRLKAITFGAIRSEKFKNYYLTLITTRDALRDIILDGVDITNQFIVHGNAAYASIIIDRGSHSLTAPDGVIAYLNGFDPSTWTESIGYSAGVSLKNLNAQLVMDDETIDGIQREACLNSEIDFAVDFDTAPDEDPPYTVFDWDFGDGQTASGQKVKHIYTVAGDYEVTLIASNGDLRCGEFETFTRDIRVLNVEVDGIIGSQSVCPDVNGIEYIVQGAEGNSYEWIVEGGTLNTNTGDKALVDWGVSNPNAFLKVIPTNDKGCIGDTITYNVVINKELEPALPQSNGVFDDGVCLSDIEDVTYFTPQTNGSIYTWEIDGEGEFINNVNTGNEVRVRWNSVAAGRIRYLESNPLIPECDGYSDYLNVTIYPVIQSIPVITSVSCHGFSDGTIQLNVSGGKEGTYTAEWDNGMSGLTITGLAAGDYEATITDQAGCMQVERYTVPQPNALEIIEANVTIDPVRCFQESNGGINLDITGGTPNAQGEYSIQVVGNNFDRTYDTSMITDLPAGDYEVTVTDANGCGVSRTYTVTEPPALAPFLDSFINQPICPQANNGKTYIEAIGGTPDYQFYWNNKSTLDSQEGSDFSRGSYFLTIVDANGCETVMDFDVKERSPKIFIPNIFSPNSETEINKEFKPVTDCDLQYSMQIFNKWGEIIFSKEDVTEGWDGTYKGKEVQDGQYSYIIFYSGVLNGVSFEETRRGSLKLFR